MSQLNSEYDFENAPCGYLSFYPNGTITQLNQMLLKWVAYRKEEVIGIKKLEDITSKGTSLYFQMFVFPLLKLQGYVNELSVSIVSSNNIITSCLLNASAIKDDGGNIQQVHAILFAIPDRKKYETEILNAKKTAEAVADHKERILQVQRRIVSILGHDTRAPLASVNQIIKFAANGEMAPEELFPYFELMANQLDATLILINDLLNWSNALLNNTKEVEAPFLLGAVVEEVFELLRGNARSKGLYLTSSIDPAVTMASNRSEVTFIIRNLINNAIKFTKEGGVTVAARVAPETITITVSDTGVGMLPDQLQKFTSGDLRSSSGTANEQGSGMGLILINDFLLNLKGSLQAESVLGKGTRVTVKLPRFASNHFPAVEEANALQKEFIRSSTAS